MLIGVDGPVWLWVVGPVKDIVAVIDAWLGAVVDAGVTGRDVQLSGETTGVTGVVEQLGDEGFVGGNHLAVGATARGARVATG